MDYPSNANLGEIDNMHIQWSNHTINQTSNAEAIATPRAKVNQTFHHGTPPPPFPPHLTLLSEFPLIAVTGRQAAELHITLPADTTRVPLALCARLAPTPPSLSSMSPTTTRPLHSRRALNRSYWISDPLPNQISSPASTAPASDPSPFTTSPANPPTPP
ncbi:hypothetical protein BOTBODRAFT_179988 [Botryobasidium botryosum FD-172 SS1]|uniref:Uncharacterized protein n=1 Tax=Botryobasidium botryosum (strain FD-172 SS1) TaxID=930990 RepID=A0A067M9E3_BOTB1|nr:hypothetical protein BOTBODRAFT_179988 [Botryobasidium botryosum FD-172 SS1]